MPKACFLDRDGVINVDYGYVGALRDFKFIEGVPQALSRIKRAGYLLVLVTNQSGIARGRFSCEDFLKLCAHMQQALRPLKADFDGIYYCPHHPQGQVEDFRKDCQGRKPGPGMLLQAAADLNIDLTESVMAGDHAGDLIAAKAAGVSRLFLVGEHLAAESPKVPEAACYADLKDLVCSGVFHHEKN